MLELALAFLGFGLAPDSVQLSSDVVEIDARQFIVPFAFDDHRHEIKQIRLFVSVDLGKTWKHVKDCKRSEKRVEYSAPRDGQYWFAIQVEGKNGKSEPSDVAELTPGMKVYVNTERRELKKKSYDDIQREVEQLKKTVEQLQTKLKDLEVERKKEGGV
jgi:valyl-tRNA synthetase